MTEEIIPLTLLLAEPARNPEGVARVQELLSGLGMVATAHGRSSVTVRVSPDRFRELFGSEPRLVMPKPSGVADKGTPGGWETAAELPVPESLVQDVSQLSIMPPASRLNPGPKIGGFPDDSST